MGGNVVGLTDSVVLQKNGGDDLTLSDDGSFSFTTPVVDGDVYAIAISGDTVYAGGSFYSIDGDSRSNFSAMVP